MAERSSWGAGAVLIVIGIAILLANLEMVDLGELIRFWPLILILIGARMVIRDRRSGSAPSSGPPPPPTSPT